MICKNCGVLNIDEAVKCVNCRARLNRTNTKFTSISNKKSKNESKEALQDKEVEILSEQEFNSLNDSEKIKILWQRKTHELQRNWKYPKFKNKKMIRIIALVLLFLPAIFSLIIFMTIQVAPNLDIHLPEKKQFDDGGYLKNYVVEMEEKNISNQLQHMEPLKIRVEKYYQVNKSLPTISNEQLKKYFMSKQDISGKSDESNITSESFMDEIYIENGTIQTKITRSDLFYEEKRLSDIQIYLVPNIKKTGQLDWRCKVLGAQIDIKGCEHLEKQLE